MKRFCVLALCVVLFAGCPPLSQVKTSRNGVAANREVKQDTKQEDDDKNPLLNPALAKEKAPDKYRVKVETSKGDFVIEVTREWSPKGADRFFNLVKAGFFKDIAIFRAIEGFMFQFGIHGDPKVSKAWKDAKIDDDESKDGVSNKPGYISFATSGKNSRTTQMFINLGDNGRLDSMGFTPFGKVIEGMEIVEKINTEYGENHRRVQMRFQAEGNAYIKEEFPKIDFIKSVSLIDEMDWKK